MAEAGFLAFRQGLNEGVWGEVPVPEKEAGKFTATMLQGLPADTRWKMRLSKAIALLAAASTSASSPIRVDVLDSHWDSSQRKLDLEIQLLAESEDAFQREVASRLAAALLQGDGRAQTQLSYDLEVDFGRRQVRVAQQTPVASDVKFAGLEKLLREIEIRTEALAEGIGRGGEESRPTARELRVQDALENCANAFHAVHDALDWDIDQSADGPDRNRLVALRRVLQGLLDNAIVAPPPVPPVLAPKAAAKPAQPKKAAKKASKKPAKKPAKKPVKKPARKAAKPAKKKAAKRR